VSLLIARLQEIYLYMFMRVIRFIGVRAREAGGCSPPDSGKTIIFRAKATFFGQKPAATNEKNTFLYLLNEKKGIHSV